MTYQKTISNIAMLCMVLLYLLNILLSISMMDIAAIAAAVVLIANLPSMGKTFRLPAWTFFLTGTAILLMQRAPLSQWLLGLTAMMSTAVVLIIMQTLSLAMHRGGYDLAVNDCLQAGTTSVSGLFCMIMLLAHLLASIMSLGSVVVILAAIGPALAGRLPSSNRFIAASISWGYCTLFLWAPGTVTVLMCMQIFNLSWQTYFFPAFILAMLGLGLGVLFALLSFRGKHMPVAVNISPKAPKASWSKVKRLGMILVIIVAGITILEQVKFSTSTGRLLMTTLLVSGGWLLLQGRGPHMAPVFRTWWNDYLPKNGDLSAFFLAMGVFSAAIQYSGFVDMLTAFCQAYQAMLSNLVLPLLPITIVLLSLIGLHPFISVLMIGPILAGMSLGAAPLQLGLAMSLGCCLSYMLSPFAGLVLALSDGLKEPPAKLCTQANLGYAVSYYFLGIYIITLIG